MIPMDLRKDKDSKPYWERSPKTVKEFACPNSYKDQYLLLSQYLEGSIKFKQDDVQQIIDSIPHLRQHINDKREKAFFNNDLYLTGYCLLKLCSNQDDFTKICNTIRKFDTAYRGNDCQRSVFDSLARQECDGTKYKIEQIRVKRAEQKTEDKTTEEKTQTPPQADMFSGAINKKL